MTLAEKLREWSLRLNLGDIETSEELEMADDLKEAADLLEESSRQLRASSELLKELLGGMDTLDQPDVEDQ